MTRECLLNFGFIVYFLEFEDFINQGLKYEYSRPETCLVALFEVTKKVNICYKKLKVQTYKIFCWKGKSLKVYMSVLVFQILKFLNVVYLKCEKR